MTPRNPGLGSNKVHVATHKPLVDDMEFENSSSDVSSNIGSCIEQLIVTDLEDVNVPDFAPDIGSPIEQVKVDDCIEFDDCDVITLLRCLV